MKQNRPYLIGLTGGIASGKSHLADVLRSAGAPVIDADAISRQLTASGGPALAAIRRAFGEQVFNDGVLNRSALANTVFAEPEKLALLNSILHPLVFAQIARQVRAWSHQPVLIIDVPLLYETGFDKVCNEVWCAYVQQREQVRRLRQRNDLTHAQALARIRSQIPGREKAHRADRVIRTDGSKEQSAVTVLALWNDVRRRLDID